MAAAPRPARARPDPVLFDRYIVVDWSANSAPKRGKDSVWICVLDASGDPETENPSTRGEAEAAVRAASRESVGQGRRVLVGFDFPYGYPRGTAAALGLNGTPWRAVWQHLASELEDDPETNANNRFDVAAAINRRLGCHAFWGRPSNSRELERLAADLSVDKSRCERGLRQLALAEYREVESILRGSMRRGEQRGRPHAVWQLSGAGCVGGQALTGIPVLQRLVRDDALAGVSAVWPFQVGIPDHPPGRPSVIHAEIWPSLFDVWARPGQVPDQAQVMAVARELRERDRVGALADLLAAPLVASPSACAEEGWILGAPVAKQRARVLATCFG